MALGKISWGILEVGLLVTVLGLVYFYESQLASPSESGPLTSKEEIQKYCNASVCKSAEITAKDIQVSLNTSIDPCDNFYHFACQQWPIHNPRPGYSGCWSDFTKLDQQTYELTNELLSKPTSPTELPIVSVTKRYFQKCMESSDFTNMAQQNKDLQFIWNKLEEYGGWPILYPNGSWNSSRFDWMKSLAGLRHEFGSTQMISVGPLQSLDGNASNNFIHICIPEPHAEFIESDIDDNESDHVSSESLIVTVAKELLRFSGNQINETWLQDVANRIVNVSAKMYSYRSEGYDLLFCYLKKKPDMTVKALQKKIDAWGPGIDILKLLNSFFANTGVVINDTQPLAVQSAWYLIRLSSVMTWVVTQEDLANFIHSKMVLNMIPLSTIEKFRRQIVTLQKTGLGTTEVRSEHEKCAELVTRAFPAAVGYEYVKARSGDRGRFSDSFKEIQNMHSNISQAFLDLLASSKSNNINYSLLSEEVQNTRLCLGYPEWILEEHLVQSEYNGLNFNESFQASASFLEQSIVIYNWVSSKVFKKLLQSRKTDKCQLNFFPGAPTPFYFQQTTYIPLAMLESTFYHDKLPRYWNYGKLGAIIGHEIAHGFAGPGWSQFVNKTNTPLAQCLIDQYSNFSLNNDFNENVNGLRTLYENLADNAGLLASYKAYKNSVELSKPQKWANLEHYSNDQLFFISFAQIWCSSSSEEEQSWAVQVEQHSLNEFRVLGVLQNSQEFANAWNCPVGSKMNPDAQEKCKMFQ